MTDLTEKEYDALDEYYTKNIIMPVGKPGFLRSAKNTASFWTMCPLRHLEVWTRCEFRRSETSSRTFG
ncbi:MAG: hypothetical protein LBS64_06070 [Spirochaetaceae bacterium]|jgi:hypothetical protein|nr:hypothetical protein [Spirochaetaceae bacterium]